MVEKLTAQLEALTALKKEHEELLLVKFKELLNAKKAKIRELDRALEATSATQDTEGIIPCFSQSWFELTLRFLQNPCKGTMAKARPLWYHQSRSWNQNQHVQEDGAKRHRRRRRRRRQKLLHRVGSANLSLHPPTQTPMTLQRRKWMWMNPQSVPHAQPARAAKF
jgi:hypothetical protein